MEQIYSIYFIVILIFLQVDNSEQEEEDFCSGSQQVDAATFSAVDRRNLLLFSGSHYWELDVDSKRVIRSHKISDKFPGVENNIDAACSVQSLGDGGYMFLKGRKAWTFVGVTNVKFNETVDWFEFAAQHDFHFEPDHPGIGCAACFCHDPENCHVIVVEKGETRKSIGCLFNYGQSISKCQLFQFIQLPERVQENLLSEINECYGLTYAMDPEQPTIIVAVDKTDVHYFQNNNKVYKTSLKDIFGCWSFAGSKSKYLLYAVGGALLFMLILCIIVIIVWRIKVANSDSSSPLLREGVDGSKLDEQQQKVPGKQTAKSIAKSKDIAKVAKIQETSKPK
ncbi:hypothetical protein B4U80_14068 [Leptotrombidium deliense]|uniref:Uncharacterized protein n=1 Tax=Leptotrombidium deliense TaxID=299467 RepID=A0A443S3G3_9ACAR|nr:hypothetical protein B4U80_14068 [Leptotrombidium deliense]